MLQCSPHPILNPVAIAGILDARLTELQKSTGRKASISCLYHIQLLRVPCFYILKQEQKTMRTFNHSTSFRAPFSLVAFRQVQVRLGLACRSRAKLVSSAWFSSSVTEARAEPFAMQLTRRHPGIMQTGLRSCSCSCPSWSAE